MATTQERGFRFTGAQTEILSPDTDLVSVVGSGYKRQLTIGTQLVEEVTGSAKTLKFHSGYAGSGTIERTIAATTTDATATVVLATAVPTSGCVGVQVFASAKRVGANADGLVAAIYNAATNNAGTVALVGSTGGSNVENSAGAPAVTIVANNTNDTIDVTVTGISAETWAWVLFIRTISVISSA